MKKTIEQRRTETKQILKFYINELAQQQEEMTTAQIHIINLYTKEFLRLTNKIAKKGNN